jgi:hypothetical protein
MKRTGWLVVGGIVLILFSGVARNNGTCNSRFKLCKTNGAMWKRIISVARICIAVS